MLNLKFIKTIKRTLDSQNNFEEEKQIWILRITIKLSHHLIME